MLSKCTEVLWNFWSSCRQRSRYNITVRQVNTVTHAVHWFTQMIWFRKVPISKATLTFSVSEFHCSIVWLNTYYVNSRYLMKFTIYYKLKDPSCTDEYSVHKMNTHVHFMCEVPATVSIHKQNADCWCCFTFLHLSEKFFWVYFG